MGYVGTFAVGGALYNVADDGSLRWFRYDGKGEQDPSAGTGWAPNTGNQIGRGWSEGVRAIFGTGGVIYVVGEDGSLRWFRYDGTGQHDPTGGTGWAPNSGNQIGNGWSAGVEGYFAVNRAIYVVGEDGLLRWFRYDGDGHADPSASTGWAANSGNPIGNGWAAGVRTVVGTGQAIFAVGEDGLLRWFRYDGDGHADPSASTGWAANSGNPIGNGWSAGVRDHFGTRNTIYTVTDDHLLHWFRYDGNGQADAGGNTGWAVNSGNAIGNGWT